MNRGKSAQAVDMASESYSISRKKLILVIAGVIFAQVTLFGAGYIASLIMRPDAALLASAQPCGPTGTAVAGAPVQSAAPVPAAGAPGASVAITAAMPKPTAAITPPAATATVAAPGVGSANSSTQALIAGGAAAPAQAAPVSAAAPEMTRASAAKADSPLAAAQAGTVQDAVAQTPEVGPAACEAPDEFSGPDAAVGRKFAIQLGAFLDPANALRLAGDLKAKGYKPCIMKAFDRQGRQWTVVRLGAFTDLAQASSFARSVYGREQIVAVVRPSGSL